MPQAFRTGPVGPAPQPNSLSRKRAGDPASWTRLPGHGLKEIPEWPAEALDADNPVTMAEQAYWDRIWREYPQAHIWKRQRMEMQVAVYVRTAVHCASGYPKSTYLTVLRQQSQELLITPHALRAARCIIDEQIDDVQEDGSRFGVAPVIQIAGSVRDRFGAQAAVAAPEDEDEDEDESGDDEA